MEAVDDLHSTSMDVLFAKDNWVCLRYSASGSHNGKPHNGMFLPRQLQSRSSLVLISMG